MDGWRDACSPSHNQSEGVDEEGGGTRRGERKDRWTDGDKSVKEEGGREGVRGIGSERHRKENTKREGEGGRGRGREEGGGKRGRRARVRTGLWRGRGGLRACR